MKNKKIIVFVVIIVLLLSVTLKVLATNEVLPETNDNTSSETGNDNGSNSENNDNNESGNNNENPGENSENENPGTEDPGTEGSGTQPEDPTSNDNPGEQPENPTGDENTGGQEEANNNDDQEPTETTNDGSTYTTGYTYTGPAKSDNANLRSLSIDVEGMSPDFSAKTTEYYVTVSLKVNEIQVQAKADDEKASVTISGNTDLKEGQNTIEITVRAEDGTTKTYKIYVTKTDDIEGTNANLKSLSVNGWTFYPMFKNNIYSYSLTIDQKVSKLEITAETENEEAKYEIVGNEDLQDGDNLIKIIVTAKDGETTKEYKINAFLSLVTVNTEKESKTQALVLLIVLGLGIAVITYFLINKK